MGGSGCNFTLLSRGEFGEIAMIVSFPEREQDCQHKASTRIKIKNEGHKQDVLDIHLVVEDLTFPRLSLRNQRLV